MKLDSIAKGGWCCELPHASVIGCQEVRGSLFRTSHRELRTVQHRIRTSPRCSVPSASQIHCPAAFYGTRPFSECSCALPFAGRPSTPPAPALNCKWAVTDIFAGKSHGASPDIKSTVNASDFDTSTRSSRLSIMR
jgi:hypothetical protein